MGTHYIPRNVKGEGRILFIFSAKSLIYSVATGIVGFLIKILGGPVFSGITGIVIIAVFAGIGYIVGTIKIPKTNSPKLQDFSGYKIDELIWKYIKFKKKGNRVYTYKNTREKGEN